MRTHTYEEIVRNPTVRALRTVASETLPKCQTCPFGPYCGYCFAETINIGGSPLPQVPVDPQCRFYCSAFPHVFRALLDRTKARILLNWVF